MSIVGPRPELPEYVELFRQDFESLLSVRPGLTDPASLEFCHESELLAQSDNPQEEYVTSILPRNILLARRFVEHRSVYLYSLIVLRTASRILLAALPMQRVNHLQKVEQCPN
jgi:lipopolysaccharide/colanic/teichoic acid biosynthesis glycosyltransferase